MRGPAIERTGGVDRIVLLGDSFAEGFGVNEEESAATIVSKVTGIPVINLGSGLDVGPLQYFLIYRGLGKNYEPNTVVIFFLPSNDFVDNDYSVWRQAGWTFVSPTSDRERYRPYWRREEVGGFSHFIPERAIRRDYIDPQSATALTVKSRLVNNTWTSNALRTASMLWRQTSRRKALGTPGRDYSGYFDSTIEQQRAAIFYLTKIIEEARGKSVILLSIPTLIDYDRMRSGGSVKDQWWYGELLDLEKKRGLIFVDLLNFSPAREVFTTYFLKCDGHWSPEGNKWAAGILTRTLYERSHRESLTGGGTASKLPIRRQVNSTLRLQPRPGPGAPARDCAPRACGKVPRKRDVGPKSPFLDLAQHRAAVTGE
jgi:hypothetical protein